MRGEVEREMGRRKEQEKRKEQSRGIKEEKLTPRMPDNTAIIFFSAFTLS